MQLHSRLVAKEEGKQLALFLGAFSLLSRFERNQQCRVALCMVQSMLAERKLGERPCKHAVLLSSRTSKEALCATTRTPAASAAATRAMNSAISGLALVPSEASRASVSLCDSRAARQLNRSFAGSRHSRSYSAS